MTNRTKISEHCFPVTLFMLYKLVSNKEVLILLRALFTCKPLTAQSRHNLMGFSCEMRTIRESHHRQFVSLDPDVFFFFFGVYYFCCCLEIPMTASEHEKRQQAHHRPVIVASLSFSHQANFVENYFYSLNTQDE